jgi:hypothetical protein
MQKRKTCPLLTRVTDEAMTTPCRGAQAKSSTATIRRFADVTAWCAIPHQAKTAVVRCIANPIAKILAFTVVHVHDAS